jgi:hypothetical protein
MTVAERHNSPDMSEDRERVLEAAGGPVAAAASLDSRRGTLDYVVEHLDELMERYSDHWIAVHDSEVIAIELTLDDLARTLPTVLEDRGVSISEVIIREMTTVPRISIA